MDKYEEALQNYNYISGNEIFDRISAENELSNQMDIINSIVLWKLNRTPFISEDTVKLIIKIKDVTFDNFDERIGDITAVILGLLKSKGVRIPIGSTILHFYNPGVFPIIDQRAYRELYKTEIPERCKSDEWVAIYIKYIKDCKTYHETKCPHIPFSRIDQVLYQLDKSSGKKVKGYGSRADT